jgi:hypothetical protein
LATGCLIATHIKENSMTKGPVLAAIIAVLACASPFCIAANEGDEAKPDLKLVKAAKATFEATQAHFEVGRANVEDLYRWSKRWLESERSSSAARKDHAKRMRNLHETVVARQRVGGQGGEAASFHATEFYLAEAEALERQ